MTGGVRLANVIKIDFNRKSCIKIEAIIKPRYVNSEMLLPATEYVESAVVAEHKSEPIKNVRDIYRISKFLIESNRYRDNMLFIVGINFGLRVSDLVQLRFSDIFNEDLSFKTTFPVLEIKTRNTRKVKKNRYITINDAVMDAVILYLEHCPASLSDFMFRSESNRGKNTNKPISRMSVDRILKDVASTLNIDCHVSTHTLRKTFAYHQMLMANNDPRKLLLLQKIFGHSSVAQTLDYIGITGEEIEEAYKELNLGAINSNTLLDSTIGEIVSA